MTRVLIVEDEESLADPLAYLLRKEGFDATVATDGPAALAEFDESGADIVLLDLMLPGMSGTDVCKQLRLRSSVPVIMLTARDSELDKVLGLSHRRHGTRLLQPWPPAQCRQPRGMRMTKANAASWYPSRQRLIGVECRRARILRACDRGIPASRSR